MTELVGQSTSMVALRARLNRVAPHQAAVLLCGESGTGKELAAQLVHRASRRRGTFIPVNCGALPPQLIEAELFGCVRGAFTGAMARDGLIASADKGTLFLDEIGDLPRPAQVVLLRVLETGQVVPVGSHQSRPVDFRLVSATHHNLADCVRAGTFRADLYHRLATLTVSLPPLRDRLDDLELLGAAMTPRAAARLTPAAWSALARYRWPGNVRELRNVILAAAIEAVGPIEPRHLLLSHQLVEHDRSLDDRVGEWVRQTLNRQGGNVRATARVLKVSPTTVYRYLNHSFDPP